MQVVDHRGVETARFRRAADARDAKARILVLGVEQLVDLPHRLAPEVIGGTQLRVLVLDVEIHRRARPALEDDHVPAGVLHLRPDEAAGVRAGDGAGQRALGHHRVAPAGGGHGAGQRPRHHDELVVGGERLDPGVDLFDEVLRGEAALPQIGLRPLHVEGLLLAGALGEVHPQHVSGPSHDFVLPSQASGCGRLGSTPCAAHARIRSIPCCSMST